MTPAYIPSVAFEELLNAMCEGELSAAQAQELETIIERDDDACRHYLCYIHLHGTLHWDGGEEQPRTSSESRQAKIASSAFSAIPAGACSAGASHLPLAEINSEVGGVSGPYSALFHNASTYLSSGWPVAYLVATVILAIGALIGAFTYVSYPENPENPENNVAWKSPAVAKDHAISPRQKEFVGQITGTFNCNWASSTQSPVTRDVAVGQEYAIASGLMEITYDTGAKVILQGPCTYAVESAASGYLSVGKLTAKMEKKDGKVASDRWPVASGEKNAGGSAFSEGLLAASHQPLFTIKTPTAIVTDLGTEFGVEIDEQGRTVSEVFAGHVSIQRLGDGNDPQRALVLGKGQTAKCGPKGEVSVSNAPSDATRFVRTIPADPTHQTCIVERFDGDKLGSAFEQMPPNRYVFEKGAAIYRQPLTTGGKQSRGYIRTVATDFCNRDFTFEVTIDIRPGAALKPDGTHSIFVGIGDGVPNGAFYDEVVTGLSLVFSADDGRLVVQSQVPSSTAAIPTNTTVAPLAAGGVLQPGKHRVRVSKYGDNIRFTFDADYDGRFSADFHGRNVKLRAVAPLLNETNSRLFVGTGNCDAVEVRFEDITITCQDNVHQKEESKPHDE